MTRFIDLLRERGLSDAEVSSKARLLEPAARTVGVSGSDGGDAFAAFVPGRIEVLGKHTDYAGGRSVLCAAERGICLTARPRTDDLITMTDVRSNERVEVRLAGQAGHRGRVGQASGPGWEVYVATVAGRLARNFAEARCGADIAFGSDLPMAAGMSSSSALVTSVLLALVAVNRLDETALYRDNISSREDLAEYLGTVENGQDFHALAGDAGVGTFGGSEDHTAMLCCRAGELSQYRFCPVRHERQIPLPAQYSFVIAVSGVVAQKTQAARDTYNQASLAARRVVALWNGATGRHDATLREAVESDTGAVERIREILAAGEPSLRPRFDQFVEETFTIIPGVGDLLAGGRVAEIAPLVDRSQRGAERGLRNQVPETTFLARTAEEVGAVCASAFGAGFGGSVWSLIGTEEVQDFCTRWRQRYLAAFPQHAQRCQFFSTRPGPAALTWGR